MTLYEIISIFKQIALSQPNIRSVSDGSIYEAMDAKNSVEYDVFHITQTTHTEDEETDIYGLTLFYVSRLEDSLEDNRLQIQSIGKEILGNVIRTFCENWSIDFPTITYIPFTQKFSDLCAGQYCNIRVEIPKDIVCADDYISEVIPHKDIKLQDLGITITENGLRVITPSAEYDGIGEIRIVTDVPQTSADLQYKEVEYTENGEYTVRPDPDYDGLTEVAVSINVPQGQGYEEGYADGVADQKAKLSSTSFTQNNSTFTRVDGWSSVTIAVDDRYDEGVADQKAKLSTLSVSANGEYTRADGYSAITVDVPQQSGGTYEEGYADGEAAQKAKLSTTSVTENGTYTREDGYSAFTVDVPSDVNNQSKTYTFTKNNTQIVQSVGGDYYLYGGEIIEPDSGYTGLDKATISLQANITDLYDSGYSAGFAAGASACSGYFITALTLNVDSAITDSGTATTTYSPDSAFTNIYYTSSNPTIATIDSGTGIITVLSSGTVTICVKDGITHLQDCKQVNATKTPEPEPEYKDRYLTTLALEDGVMTLSQTEAFRNPTYYRINKGAWLQMPTSSTTVDIQVQSGDVVEYKSAPSISSYVHISSNCAFETYGNVMSLAYSDDFRDKVTISSTTYNFSGLFMGDTGLTSAGNLILPATALTQNCYNQMFAGCTSLTTAPSLPATKLANNCYYNMFAGCTSLASAPVLPDVDFEEPGSAIPQFAYVRMFYGCSSLNYIKCLVSSKTSGTDGNNLFEDWVNGVSGSGTFVRTANIQWNSGNNGIPANWTIIDNS